MNDNDPLNPDARDRQGAVPPATRPADIPVASNRRAAALGAADTPRSNPLKWLVPLALLLIIGFALTRNRGDDSVATVDPSSTSTAAGEVVGGSATAGGAATAGATDAGAVQRFVTWANEGGAAALPQESEDDHPYTTQGIRLLADALGATAAGQGTENAAVVTRIRSQADRLQRAPGDDRHAEYAHAAFLDAAKLMATLPNVQADGLEQAAHAVSPGQPLSPQGVQVRAFFRQAARALPTAGATGM